METDKLQHHFDSAVSLESKTPDQAALIFHEIVVAPSDGGEGAAKIKEEAIYRLVAILARLGRAEALGALLTTIRPFFSTVSKAKTTKIVRALINHLAEIPNTLSFQIALCEESIEWARETERTFLRHRIEARLCALLLEAKEYTRALSIIGDLLREVKRLDDKALLVEIHLTESRIHHALRNVPKAKAALTAARSNANSIYCPPALQAQLDMQSGALHADEKDFKTAFSYFYEAFEGLSSQDKPDAIHALTYMLLCKIMTDAAPEVRSLLSGKVALNYKGRSLDAMQAVANAYSARSMEQLEKATETYKTELTGDTLIANHLNTLADALLDQNLLRITEPFSCVEVVHIAKLIKLSVDLVEKKLSKMILDKKLHGILDQGAGTLIVFDNPPSDLIYPSALGTIEEMGHVVDSLYNKAARLS